MRFDLRNIDQSRNAELYREALEMAEWADRSGFDVVQLAEHHSCADGYIPSPITFAGGLAVRTRNVALRLVLVLPLHDPIRLAEDLATLDIMSNGRVVPVLAGGYSPREFEMFGVALKDRPKLMVEGIETIRKAWTGEPFEYRGRQAQVLPRPVQQPRPPIWMGGSSPAAARRAAEYSDRFYSNDTALWDIYRARCQELGRDPGPAPDLGTGFFLVAEDPDREWQRMAPYFAAELQTYSAIGASTRQLLGDAIRQDVDESGQESESGLQINLEAIKALNAYPILNPDEAVAHFRQMRPFDDLTLNPLISGLPSDIAWEHLRTFERYILPQVRAAA